MESSKTFKSITMPTTLLLRSARKWLKALTVVIFSKMLSFTKVLRNSECMSKNLTKNSLETVGSRQTW
jgi:hypothetical protein